MAENTHKGTVPGSHLIYWCTFLFPVHCTSDCSHLGNIGFILSSIFPNALGLGFCTEKSNVRLGATTSNLRYG